MFGNAMVFGGSGGRGGRACVVSMSVASFGGSGDGMYGIIIRTHVFCMFLSTCHRLLGTTS